MAVVSEHHHRNLQGGGARAAVFGISDGLVSNVALVLGMAGAHASAHTIRLAGVAGLIGGAFSMAAGEYVSMRAQTELMERELAVERVALSSEPDIERDELAAIYKGRGLDPDLADELAAKMMRDPRDRPRDPRPRGARHRSQPAGQPRPGGRVVVPDLRRRGVHPAPALAGRFGGCGPVGIGGPHGRRLVGRRYGAVDLHRPAPAVVGPTPAADLRRWPPG